MFLMVWSVRFNKIKFAPSLETFVLAVNTVSMISDEP